jgi:succinylglutamate desuccinylase
MQNTRNQNLSFFLNNQNTNLSFSYEIDSGNTGKKVVIVGATHGSEPVGVDAIMKIIQEIEAQKLGLRSGKILFILGNPLAYLGDTRFINKNLNREFKEIQNPANYEQHRAKEISNFLKDYDPDFLLDLHSVSLGDEQMEIYDKDSKMSKELLDESVLQIILDQKVMPGGLCQLPFLKSAMAMECGNHNSQFGLERALTKIHSILEFYKITEDASNAKAASKQIANKYQFIDVIKPEKGFKFTDPNICTEYFLKKDQVYCAHRDSNGEKVEVKAKQDCYVLIPTLNPSFDDSDAGFLAIKIN